MGGGEMCVRVFRSFSETLATRIVTRRSARRASERQVAGR